MHILKKLVLITILSLTIAACTASPQIPASGVEDVTATSAPAMPAETLPTDTPAADMGATSTPAATTDMPVEVSAGGVTYGLVPERSEANYRITEQLANNDLPNDAVGKTSAMSGSITIRADGTIDTATSQFTVDLSTLTSDRDMRDNYVRRNILDTTQYPEAVFVPTAITGLSMPFPESGSVNFQVTGDLTIKDVTHPVTWDVTGEVANGEATGKATTSFTFETFNLPQPSVPIVLSLEDNIILEVMVTLTAK